MKTLLSEKKHGLPAGGEERSVSYALRERGFSVSVVPLQRIMWLNVLRSPPPRERSHSMVNV